jgi:hypothetical protein
MSKSALVLLLVAGVTAAAAAALGVARYTGGSEDSRAIVVGSSSYRWPVETLRDWADYADQLSVLSIESEKQLPRSREDVARGEGPVGRTVTAQIEETLWRNPGSSAVEGEITFATWGWIAKGDRLIPAVDSDSHRLEVGDRVLVPLLLTPEKVWAPVTPSSAIRLVDGRTVFAGRQRRSLPELAAALDGVTARSVADRLASVQPRPNADALRRLDPDERARELAASP